MGSGPLLAVVVVVELPLGTACCVGGGIADRRAVAPAADDPPVQEEEAVIASIRAIVDGDIDTAGIVDAVSVALVEAR